MDLNLFAKAIGDYQAAIEKLTSEYNSKIVEAQSNLVNALSRHDAKEPRPTAEDIYKDVVKISRGDYEELQKQIALIASVHPELNKAKENML